MSSRTEIPTWMASLKHVEVELSVVLRRRSFSRAVQAALKSRDVKPAPPIDEDRRRDLTEELPRLAQKLRANADFDIARSHQQVVNDEPRQPCPARLMALFAQIEQIVGVNVEPLVFKGIEHEGAHCHVGVVGKTAELLA